MKKSERNGCSNETIHIWPHVGKAKMHLRVSIVSDFFTIFQKIPILKRILAFPTCGQICTVSVLQPFSSDIFQTVHLANSEFLK